MRSVLAIAVAMLGCAQACGRIGYDEGAAGASDGPAPLVERGVLAPAPYAITERADAPGFAIAFARALHGSTQVELALVITDETGAIEGEPIVLAALERWLDYVALFSSEAGHVVFYRPVNSRALHVVRLDTGGRVVGTIDLGSRAHAAVAPSPSGFVVAYGHSTVSSGANEPHVTFLDNTGAEMGSPRLIEPTTRDQVQFELALTGDRIVVVWQDTDGDVARIASLSLDGVPIAPSAQLSTTTALPRAIVPDDEGGAIVAWEQQRSCRVRRVDVSLAPAWAEDVVLPANRDESQDIALAVLDGNVWTAWQSDDASVLPRVDLGRAPIGGPPLAGRERLAHDDASACCPAAASGHGRVAVVYESPRENRLGPWLRIVGP